jgi:hypothetical protein
LQVEQRGSHRRKFTLGGWKAEAGLRPMAEREERGWHKKRRRKSEYFASRGGVGVAYKALGETAAPALPGRPAISLAEQH